MDARAQAHRPFGVPVIGRDLVAGVVLVLSSNLVAGCVVFPTAANVTTTGQLSAPTRGIALAVVFSHDHAPETPRHLGKEMVECIVKGVADSAPDVRVVSAEEFHRVVFGVRPGEVLLRADTIVSLLSRPEIKQRVEDSGLTHLILVAGSTHHRPGQPFGGALPPALAIGGLRTTRSTRLTASIVELASATGATLEARAEDTQGVGAGAVIFPFAWGWVHATESSACKALGGEVVGAIRGRSP